MAVILNASTSTGFVQSADTSGVLTLQSNGTNAASVSGSNFQFNSGYGSVATAYGCRAWVNFDGTGTVAIRAAGNVSSITDNGTGLYRVNFSTALADGNYCVVLGKGLSTTATSNLHNGFNVYNVTTTYFDSAHSNGVASNVNYDPAIVMYAIFR